MGSIPVGATPKAALLIWSGFFYKTVVGLNRLPISGDNVCAFRSFLRMNFRRFDSQTLIPRIFILSL